MSDLSDFEDDEGINETSSIFDRATNFVQKNVDKIDQVKLLEFYGLFKQATVGQCNTPKPGMFNLQAKAKWGAWNRLGELPREEAMNLYVQSVCSLFPDRFRPELDSSTKDSSWAAVSSLRCEDVDIPENEKNAFDFVKESNLTKLKALLEPVKKFDINRVDDIGLGLIHWASDRGDPETLQLLLDGGADVNLCDSDGQTGLHYAASCGNIECVRLLLQYKPNLSICDHSGQTCLDAADNVEIAELLGNFKIE